MSEYMQMSVHKTINNKQGFFLYIWSYYKSIEVNIPDWFKRWREGGRQRHPPLASIRPGEATNTRWTDFPTRDEGHEVDGPSGDQVDDGADVEAQSLEQQCLADVVFAWGLDFI